ncbi:MAG: hypothetical protein ACE5IY_12585 [bacterium]
MNTIAKSSKLSHLVSSICQGQYKETELTEFVNLVQKISLSYLKYQEVIGKHIRWERNKNMGELEDLALDCVAGLFMRNDEGEFVQFKKYFEQNDARPQELDEVEILVMLRRLVIKKTKQELSRIFKERDPEGAKIVRNIKVAIKSSPDFHSFKEMGREYIYWTNGHTRYLQVQRVDDSTVGAPTNGTPTNGQSNGPNGRRFRKGLNGTNNGNGISNGALIDYLRKSQPAIPEKSLKGEYLNVYCPKDPVSAGIRKMLAVVKQDERYQNFLPLDMVARIMRHTNLEMARDRLTAQITDVSPLDDLKLKEIEKRKHAVLRKIKRKIQNQYVSTHKISETKGDIYYKALAEILDDISQGKKYDSYFKHLKRYMPELSQRAYRTQERTIFEYLGKLIKKWFRESLLELL